MLVARFMIISQPWSQPGITSPSVTVAGVGAGAGATGADLPLIALDETYNLTRKKKKRFISV